MLVGIVVGIITLIVAAVLVAAFFVVRSRRHGSVVHSDRGGADPVKSVDNVGFSRGGLAAGRGETSVNTRSFSGTTGKPSEMLRPRFVAVGVLAAAVFGSLGTKLWSMQVLSADRYRSEAAENKYSTVATPAPRGQIYDRNGLLLAKNRSTITVLADASVGDDHDVMQRLSTVLGLPYNVVRMRVKDESSGAQGQRIVAADASQRDAAFIAEHSDAFSGVTVQTRTTREYPYVALAAHVLGYTGPVSEEELENVPANRTIELGDVVGKSGVEAYYDNILSGEHGQRRVVVDSRGQVVEVESETAATRGNDIYLTLDSAVQYVAERELAALIAPDGVIGHGKGCAGAVVALDATDGSILAMASYPTFDPTQFTGGIAQDIWDLYATEESYYPLLNRCISGTYPAASTYKAFTSLAGLKYGFADGERTWDCEGSWDGFNTGSWQNCWNTYGHGEIDLHRGIVVSCDVVFYEIAREFFLAGKSQGGNISDTALQEEIAHFGFGRPTDVDLLGEEAGRIPTAEWKAQYWEDVPAEADWRGGDLTNLVIGQGDVLITPLQNAVAYGAVATGKLMKPHLLKEVHNTNDETAVVFEPVVVAEPEFKADDYQLVRDALKEVSLWDRTIANVLSGWGVDVSEIGAKTGTGEVAGKGDVAWYVCYYPNDNPRYVVATCIEQGGGGAVVAGPPAAQVLGACVAASRGNLTADDVHPLAGSTGKSDELDVVVEQRTD